MTPAVRPTRPRRRPAVLAWTLWALFLLGMAAVAWLDHLLRQAARPDLARLTAQYAYSVLGVVSAASVGAVVASRRPRHPVGWLLLAFGLLTVVSEVAQVYVGYAVLARPGALPAAGVAVVAAYSLGLTAAPVPVLALALLLTPTGSLPSPRWRWVAGALVAVLAINALGAPVVEQGGLDPPLQSVTSPLAVDALAGPLLDAVGIALGGVFVLAILAAAGSLVVRFRRARGVERQQLRWVALAAALAPLAALVYIAGNLIGHPAVTAVTGAAPGAATWLLPMALGAAVLRYRLYDLDRIISRTIAYGLLTAILGLGYAVVVLGLGQVLGRGGSSLAVAAATLAMAAAFRPARRRVQALVDRRFDRRRYDAARTIETFSGRLRQQIDLDALTTELLAVIDTTMQPTRVSLWLRPGSRPGASPADAAAPHRA